MAYLEVKIVITYLLQRYKFKLHKDQIVKHDARCVTLRAKYGMNMNVFYANEST